MAKKIYPEGSFGAYFVDLLKKHDYSQARFVTELGISKTYLVEVLNGSLKPPTPEMQEKIATLLKLSEEERYILYDKCAEKRNELPKDIFEFFKENEDEIKKLREKIALQKIV